MHYRSVFLAGLLVAAGPAQLVWAQAAQTAEPPATAAANGLPARPTPFKFVNDQGSLLSSANAKQLESGLRKYADETGTQVVVVTVPTLGGREVADYGRALGNAWGVGQRGKNNGVVVLIAGKERKVTIQAGSGLADRVTPAVVQQVIGQQFGPNFKQGNYFAGLRKGLSTLMLAANPSTNPRRDAAGTAAGATGAVGAAGATGPELNAEGNGPALSSGQEPVSSGGGGLVTPPAPAEPSGPGFGTLALGALGIGGLIWLLMKLFRRNQTPTAGNAAGGVPNMNSNQPNFNPNQPNRPGGGAPNFLPNQGQQQGGNYGPNNGPGYNNGPGMMGGGGGGLMGGGMGGMLATGAAAAAGAYLGNRMAGGGQEHVGGNELGGQQQAGLGGGLGAGAAGVGGAGLGAGAAAGDDYFANRDGGATGGAGEADYFSDDNSAADSGNDYFSDDSGSSSYDDMSSGDSGGGGFDGGGGDDSGSF
ncbi:TPM domain-containing protein [uncultured Hymenobacter sp.]|uniref:TPM domain-containing protein n=1 Tax=uncultured Hymenobacter sp. TaxID=170016 RepID=UPI0035CB6ECA